MGIPDCRRCHSDRCAALYRCFQYGMYRRTKKTKLNRHARLKRQQLAITSSTEQLALLQKLQALEAEKGQFEAQLQNEQKSIFAELEELQSMMAGLGIDLDTATAE